eukprot:GHRR01014679.1.p1 GENE.GHRR01014679.1~~GHRR01014679.1.p1  ORF type:complete len:322 (+),score=113.59 GHRR01014679.1:150-1115(+)
MYADAPWTFKGRALYQLQLVKADEARRYIPPELTLVEMFGYTLGGVYLARYDDSPAGRFDECVVLAGLVWNPPTSCAWAARVFVNDKEARDHGIKSVGLPSRLASFNALCQSATSSTAWWKVTPANGKPASAVATREQPPPGCTTQGGGGSSSELVELSNVDRGRRGLPGRLVAVFKLPAVPATGFCGPRLTLSLPSFSGATLEHPGMLQYSCDLHTNIMAVQPISVQLPASTSSPLPGNLLALNSGSSKKEKGTSSSDERRQQHPEVLDLLLSGKPLLCLAFSDMVASIWSLGRRTAWQLPSSAAAVNTFTEDCSFLAPH